MFNFKQVKKIEMPYKYNLHKACNFNPSQIAQQNDIINYVNYQLICEEYVPVSKQYIQINRRDLVILIDFYVELC